jgi:hypothetical protein
MVRSENVTCIKLVTCDMQRETSPLAAPLLVHGYVMTQLLQVVRAFVVMVRSENITRVKLVTRDMQRVDVSTSRTVTCSRLRYESIVTSGYAPLGLTLTFEVMFCNKIDNF